MSQDTNQSPPATSADVPAGFTEFYGSYRPRLLRFVQGTRQGDGLPEAHLDTEGVVQETFEAAFKKWATIDHPERWIYAVAARKVRRHSRQEWFQDRELRERLKAECSKGCDSDPVHTHAVAGAIVDRIMALPTNQRIATYLRTVEEWTGPEIAQVLGITPATAYVHVSRGINVVRRREKETRYIIQFRLIPWWLVALEALLITVGLAAWIYPKLAIGFGVLVAGAAMAWLLAAGVRWCAHRVRSGTLGPPNAASQEVRQGQQPRWPT
jgi:RNA polymerase sigma factor (sigma-70 family)